MTLQNRIAKIHLSNQKPGIPFTRSCTRCQQFMPVGGGSVKTVNGKREFMCRICKENTRLKYEI